MTKIIMEMIMTMMMMMGARAQFSPGAAQEARIVNNGGGANLRPVLLADNDLSDFELFEVRHTLTTSTQIDKLNQVYFQPVLTSDNQYY